MPDVLKNSHLVVDDVHSFVLRVNLNPAPDGRRAVRPQFRLEYVNKGIKHRMQNLDEILKELTTSIELILQRPDGGFD